jgi:tetratricopeptide (TPR) repeat protein
MKKGPVIAVLISVGLLGAFLLMPRTIQKEEVIAESLDQKIEKAINMVTSEAPMQGIMLLREVLAEDPENIKALSALGLFSIQSNQLEKAIGRFEQIRTIDPQNQLALEKLVDLYASTKQPELQIECLKALYEIEKESNKRQRIQDRLKKLENEIVKS